MEDSQNDPFAGDWVPGSIVSLLHEAGITDLNRYFGCMMLAQGSIDDDLRRVLMVEAVSLICLRRKKGHFKHEFCEGLVQTNFDSATLEHISDIKFECEVDVESKTTKAVFIITSRLLERFKGAEWLSKLADDGQPLKTSYFN